MIFFYRFSKENSDVKSVSSIQSSPSFTNFEEKRRSNLNIRNPIRQMVNRAGSLRCNLTKKRKES